ncbi:hypothetical protein [Streptomyces sp. NPDC002088]|uniref:hypothetical protein n=1 Tax=Streptomyces sp. NPDC002088 TaxID=3154665 RepID=UPI00331E856C
MPSTPRTATTSPCGSGCSRASRRSPRWGVPDSSATVTAPGRNVVATDADSALFTGEHLAVRASAPGTYTTRLNRGRTVTTTVPSLPATVTPARWQLDVEDWRPDPTPNRTERVDVSLTLDTLLPWSNIPELADSAGIGRYRTTLDLPSDWSPSHGAHLELGKVSDTCRITVNGTPLPPVNRLNPVIDLGPGLLRRGANLIEVEVAIPLINRLRVAQPAVFGAVARQDHGLIGPVRLTPYLQTDVS